MRTFILYWQLSCDQMLSKDHGDIQIHSSLLDHQQGFKTQEINETGPPSDMPCHKQRCPVTTKGWEGGYARQGHQGYSPADAVTLPSRPFPDI